MAELRDIIVIGTSAGGLEALQRFVQRLPADLPAAMFIVNHMSSQSPGFITEILQRKSPLRVESAEDRKPIERNCIYTPAVDRHLMVDAEYMYTPLGPAENNARPAIDPLFRSAAVYHTWRVIGILLTGMLDDGTSGLMAVKQCGGLAVVQDPADALYPEMCLSALDYVDVDHCAPLIDIPPLLETLVKSGQPVDVNVPHTLIEEVNFSMGRNNEITEQTRTGELVPLTCPTCGGPMWQAPGEQFPRYRCYTGHHFTARALSQALSLKTEKSLWFSLQMIKERIRLLERMADDHKQKNHTQSADVYSRRVAEFKDHARHLQNLLETFRSSAE